MKNYMHMIYVLLLAILAGCSIFPFSGGGEPARKFTLGYTKVTPDVNELKARLLVDTPNVSLALDTLRIALKTSERTIEYFADVEWANRLGALVQESLVYSLQNTQKLASVSRPIEAMRATKSLKIEVRGFYIDTFSSHPEKLAHVDYLAQIIDLHSRRVMSSQDFRATVSINVESMEFYVQALNQAHIEATTKMVKWVIETLKHKKTDDTNEGEDKQTKKSKKKAKASSSEQDTKEESDDNEDD